MYVRTVCLSYRASARRCCVGLSVVGLLSAVVFGLQAVLPGTTSAVDTFTVNDIGDGYSSIACDGKRLYTMYRPTDEEKNKTDEVVIALDPASGETIWEFKYRAPFVEGMDANFGRGPHSTPLIVGD